MNNFWAGVFAVLISLVRVIISSCAAGGTVLLLWWLLSLIGLLPAPSFRPFLVILGAIFILKLAWRTYMVLTVLKIQREEQRNTYDDTNY